MTAFSDTLTEAPALNETGTAVVYKVFPTLIENLADTDSLPVTKYSFPTLTESLANTDSPPLTIGRFDVFTETLSLVEVNISYVPFTGIISESLALTEAMTGAKTSFDVLTDAAANTDTLVGAWYFPVTGVDGMTTSDLAGAALSAGAVITENFVLALSITSGGETYIGWAANYMTAAHAMWTNFGFNALATDKGNVAYGTMSDGIYRLEGATDDGAAINASLLTGKMDFGDSRVKSLKGAFLGVSANGKLFVRVIQDDGEQFIYEATAVRENEDVMEVRTGRGIRSRYLQFEIYNANGADFELSSVEFFPLVLTRQR